MIPVSILSGIALGMGILLLVRRDRAGQLVALAVLALALALAFVLAGAVVPALGMILLGGVATTLMLAPLNREPTPTPDLAILSRSRFRGTLIAEGLVVAAAVALLIASGFAGRSGFHGRHAQTPSVGMVGHQILLGVGVAMLGLILLTATVMVGMTALIRRDRRELAEDQAEAVRRRRAAEQERRFRQREAARAAARQARRGSSR